jgi:hypothetical protein
MEKNNKVHMRKKKIRRVRGRSKEENRYINDKNIGGQKKERID